MPSNVSLLLLRSIVVLCCGALPLVAACDNGDDEDEPSHDAGEDLDAEHDEADVGVPSGATCPDDAGMLTYDDFGKNFMETYCTRCHSSGLEGAARHNAPVAHDFDSYEGILLVAEHIDEMAAAGPTQTNDEMPPDGLKPTLEERQALGQWLACEQAR